MVHLIRSLLLIGGGFALGWQIGDLVSIDLDNYELTPVRTLIGGVCGAFVALGFDIFLRLRERKTCNYSTRDLLIGTTVIAVVLGALVSILRWLDTIDWGQ